MKKAVRTGEMRDPIIAMIVQQDKELRALGIATTVQWVKGHSVSVGNNCADVLAAFGSEASLAGAPDDTRFDNPESWKLEAVVKGTAHRQKYQEEKRIRELSKQDVRYREWEQHYRQHEEHQDRKQKIRRSQRLAAHGH